MEGVVREGVVAKEGEGGREGGSNNTLQRHTSFLSPLPPSLPPSCVPAARARSAPLENQGEPISRTRVWVLLPDRCLKAWKRSGPPRPSLRVLMLVGLCSR